MLISSMGAKVPASQLSVYVATKYGLRGFGACLRQDMASVGVGVSVVFPGSINDVGMWAESRGPRSSVGTVSSSAVVDGVIRAIEHNKAEVDIAPWPVRIAGILAHVAPEAFERIARRSGADKQTADLARGLRHKR